MTANVPDVLPRRAFLRWLLFVVVASPVLSIWALNVDDVINNDGIEYLRSAQAWVDGDVLGALRLWKWPFYPLLIASLSSGFGFDIEIAAHVINAVLFTCLGVVFLAAVRELGGRNTTLLFATAVFLLHPVFNEYRSFIIRDPGYLVGYMTGLFFLFRLARTGARGCLVGAFVGFTVATLFRIEGAVFVALLPYLLYANSQTETRSRWVLLLTLGVIALALFGLFGWWALESTPKVDTLGVLDRPLDVLTAGWAQVGNNVQAKIQLLEQEFLSNYSSGYSAILYILTVATVVFSSLLSELTVVYAAILLYGFKRKTRFPVDAATRYWAVMIAANILILVGFTVSRLFLAPRYPLALILTLLLMVPFVLEALVRRWQRDLPFRTWRQWLVPTLAAIAIIGVGINGLTKFTGKRYLKEAGLWVRAELPAGVHLVTNDRKLAYYAGRHRSDGSEVIEGRKFIDKVQWHKWQPNDLVAIRVTRRPRQLEALVREEMKGEPVKVFESDRGEKVLIYFYR